MVLKNNDDDFYDEIQVLAKNQPSISILR